MSRTPMRAALHTRYGEPDVLTVGAIARPVPGADQVLVHVHAAAVTIGDHHMVTGLPYIVRFTPMGGLPHPKQRVPGLAMAGRIVAVGANVTDFAIGDEIFGEAPGAFGEYVVASPARIAKKPTRLSFAEAAAAPWAVTALQGLRDEARLQAGQRLLVNGASGGVGTWAVQIGKALGAHVTAVCSTRNIELVRSLGADEVIDYTQRDFVTEAQRYDVVFDTVANRSVAECRRVLTPRGAYVACAGGASTWSFLARVVGLMVRSLFTPQTLKSMVVASNHRDLVAVQELIDAGKARPAIEKQYELDAIGAALSHVGTGHSRGQTVVRVAP